MSEDESYKESLKETMQVDSITSSFSLENRHRGVKTSSFVSYTVKPSKEEGWSLGEARLVEAILAERVSKDLYADLGTRGQIDLTKIKEQQQMITRNYGKLISNLQKSMESDDKIDVEELVETAREVENG